MRGEAAEGAYVICGMAYMLLVCAPALALMLSGREIDLSVMVCSRKGMSALQLRSFETELAWASVCGFCAYMLIQAALRIAWLVNPDGVWSGFWLVTGATVFAAALTGCVLAFKRKTLAAAATAVSACIGLFWAFLMVIIALQLNH